MAEMDEFAAFILAGLIIIVVFLLLFGGVVNWSSSEESSSAIISSEKNLTSANLVGMEDVISHARYVTSFDVSYRQGKDAFYLGNREFFSGLIFGSNPLKYRLNLSDVKSMSINFRLTETNNYAPLVFMINGNVFAKDVYPIGDYNLTVPSDFVSDFMDVEIFVESSGWKIWAPSVYTLENIKFVVDSFSKRDNEFGFEMPESVYNSFREGKIEISHFDKSLGTLKLTLNGYPLFSNRVSSSLVVSFDKNKTKPGFNTLVFDSEKNSQFSGDADVLVFYNEPKERTLELPFNVTQERLDNMTSGEITFSIMNIESQGGFSLKILYNSSVLFSTYSAAEEQDYFFEFNKSNVKKGVNTLVIEPVDNAIFYAKDVEINFEDA